MVDLRDMEGYCTGSRSLAFRARPWYDVRVVTSNTQLEIAWHANERHCAGYLSGGGKPHELAARARRGALAAVGLRTMEGHCTSGRRLSFGARPWCDVRAVASNAQPSFAWHARKRRCAGYLSGYGEIRKLEARAHRAALVDVAPRTIEEYCTGERILTLGARPWGDVLAVPSNAQPAFAWHANKRNCGGCQSGGGEIRKLAARARLAALVVIGVRDMEGYCTGGSSLSFHVRQWYDVRAVTSNAQLEIAWPANERYCAGYLSINGKPHELAVRARRGALAAIGLRAMERHCTSDRPLSFVARPWFDVRAVASNAQPPFACHARKRRCAGCLSGCGEIRELEARAHRATRVDVGARTIERYCTGERILTLGARPWGDVRGVPSNAQPAFEWHVKTSATAVAVCREVAKHASLPRARAVPRWLCSVRAPSRGTAPAEGLSFGARPWCDVRAVTSNALPAFAWHARKRRCAGCVSGCVETRELEARVHRAALFVICLRTIEGYCTGGRLVTLGARPWGDVRSVPSNVQHGTRTSATALAVSRKVAKHASLPCARAVPWRLWLSYVLQQDTAPATGFSLSAQDRGLTCEL